MQFKVIAFFFSLAALVAAQIVPTPVAWTSISPCESTCVTTGAAAAGCAPTDFACLCESDSFYNTIAACPTTCPTSSGATLAQLTQQCTALDWTWRKAACIRNCARQAAQAVGCAIWDVACLCRKRAAFLAAFLACVRRDCLTLVADAQTAVDTGLVCPVVDPVPTTATIIGAV